MENQIKLFQSSQIRVREDGYFSATDMCQACGKLFGHWFALKATTEYLQALERSIEIASTELVQIIQGGIPQNQGTWVHPQVALELARWLSPSFSVVINSWVTNLDFFSSVEYNKQDNRSGFVYLIDCQGKYKIGISKKPYQRKSRLQIGTPFELTILELYFSFDCMKLEKALHEHFDAYKIRSEWFELPEEEVKDFLETASELDKQIETEIDLLQG